MPRLVMRMKIVQYTFCTLALAGMLGCNQQSQNAVEPTVTPQVKPAKPTKPDKPRPPAKPVKPVKPVKPAPAVPVAPAASVTPPESTPGQVEIGTTPVTSEPVQPTKLNPLGKRVSHVPMKGKYVALTFDDGPHPTLTNKALDILKRHGAKGTFFMLGQNANRYKTIVSRAAAEGHELGVHTWSHIKMNSSSRAKVDNEVSRTQNVLAAATGVTPRVMRPPYGATNKTLVDYMYNHYGMASILWDVDTIDWRKPGVSKVINTAVNKAKPGSIILVHDIHASTIEALEGIVTGLQARGFQLVTVSELMAMGKREEEAAASPATEPMAAPAPEQPSAEPVTEELTEAAAETVLPSEPAPAPETAPHPASDAETPLYLETLELN